MRRNLLIVAILSAAASPANAKDCSKIGDYKEMVVCHAEEARQAEVEMTRAYDALVRKIGTSPQRDLLRRSQAAWLDYRTAYCSFVSSAVQGGSIQPTIHSVCYADITRLRLKELEHQLNCREGDLSCVSPSRQP